MNAKEFQLKYGKPTVKVGNVGTRLPKLRKPNRIEAEWLRLSAEDNACAHYEPFTLRLPDGTSYTPDVVTAAYTQIGIGLNLTCYEVKGPFEHNDRWKLKFKQARAAFPWMRFVIAKKGGDGNWTVSKEEDSTPKSSGG